MPDPTTTTARALTDSILDTEITSTSIRGELAQLTWRALLQRLKEAGLTRRARETKAQIVDRLAEASGVGSAPTLTVASGLLIEGAPAVLALAAASLPPGDVRFLSPRALVIPAERRAAVRRSLAAHGIVIEDPVTRRTRRTDPERAARLFVSRLASRLGWPLTMVAGLPPSDQLNREPRPIRRQIAAWEALLDHSLRSSTALSDEPDLSPNPQAPVDREAIRSILAAAIDAEAPVAIRYQSSSRIETTDRVILPFALVTRGGVSYLHAYCRLRAADRVFRLDRVLDVSPIDERGSTAAD